MQQFDQEEKELKVEDNFNTPITGHTPTFPQLWKTSSLTAISFSVRKKEVESVKKKICGVRIQNTFQAIYKKY